MTRTRADNTLEHITETLSAEPDIRLAYVFGSMAADSAGPASDLDVAVLADRPLDAARRAELIARLADRIGRPVDLVDLHAAGVMVLRSALCGGRRLVCRDRRAHEQLVNRMLTDTEDFLPYRERMLRQRRRAWTG